MAAALISVGPKLGRTDASLLHAVRLQGGASCCPGSVAANAVVETKPLAAGSAFPRVLPPVVVSGVLTSGLVWGGAREAVAALWVHPYIYSIFAAILSFILVFRAQVRGAQRGQSRADASMPCTACNVGLLAYSPCHTLALNPQYGYNRYWEARTQLQVMSMRLTDAAAQVRSWCSKCRGCVCKPLSTG